MIESSFEITVSSKNKPFLIASSHEFHFKRKIKFNENWIGSKYQTYKSRATAITENNELIETRGEHNHDISGGPKCHKTFKRSQREIYPDCCNCQCGFASYKRYGHSVCPRPQIKTN